MFASTGRSEAHHDVETGGELVGSSSFERREIDDHRGALLVIADPAQDAVAFVLRLTLDVTLGGPLFAALEFDREMDVRRPAGVGDWLDRPKIILAGGTGEKPAETLEVRIALVVAVAALMEIDAVMIDLPDLDQGVADRIALGIEDPTAEVGNFSERGIQGVVDDDQCRYRASTG